MAEALLIVDFQNDFTPGGALGVDGGDEIAGRLNELAADARFEVDKGQDVDADGYAGFEATLLEELLRARGVDHVTIGGIATDYCVKNTALDALRLGFGVTVGVTVDRDAVRGVEVSPGDSEAALDEIRAAGGVVS